MEEQLEWSIETRNECGDTYNSMTKHCNSREEAEQEFKNSMQELIASNRMNDCIVLVYGNESYGYDDVVCFSIDDRYKKSIIEAELSEYISNEENCFATNQ